MLLIGGQHKGWVRAKRSGHARRRPRILFAVHPALWFRAWAYHMRALPCELKGGLHSAIADYQTPLRLKPTKYNYTGPWAGVWIATKTTAKALADFKQAIRLDPSFALAYNNAAWLRATCRRSAFAMARKQSNWRPKPASRPTGRSQLYRYARRGLCRSRRLRLGRQVPGEGR